METVYLKLKENWNTTKSQIKELGIDPDKDFDDLKLTELQSLAEHLEITISEFISHTI